MATSYVDFQSDTAGTAPDGMTLRHATTHTAMIRDVSGDLVLRMEDDGASGADFCFVTDDAAGTAVTEGEIYAKFTHYEGSAFADLDPYIVIRGATGAANCYGLTHYGSDWAIVYYAGGSASAVVVTGFSSVTTTGVKHAILGANATTGLYFRIWADGGGDPGAGSNATGTHGSLASGGLGFGSDGYGAQGQIYQYGIGTGGDAAPQSGGGGGDVSRTLDESVTVTDETQPVRKFARQLEDAVVAADSLLGGILRGRTLQELLTVDDDPSVSKVYIVTLDSGVDVYDDVTLGTLRGRTVQDAIEVVDSAILYRAYTRQLDDNLATFDELAKAAAFYRVLEDALSLYDDVIVVRSGASNYVVVLDDSLGVYDEIQTSALYTRLVSESAAIFEELLSGALRGRTVEDSVATSDESLFGTLRGRTVEEALSINDLTDRAANFVRNLVENIDLYESLSAVTSGAAPTFTTAARIHIGVQSLIVIGTEQPISIGAYH